MTSSVIGTCACSPVNTYGSYAAVTAYSAEATYSKASDIVIETLEGDRVTLSTSAYATGGYETYEAFAIGGGAAARQYGASAYFESSQELSLSVSGDLNQQELNDISKILRTLDKMMNDLAAGDLKSALAGSARFSGIDSISSFSADMSITASVAVGRYEAAAVSIPLPAGETGDGHAVGRIDRAADNFSRGLNAKTASTGNLVETLEKYFSDWFEERSAENEGHDKGMNWASRFARRLMEGLLNDRGSEEPKNGKSGKVYSDLSFYATSDFRAVQPSGVPTPVEISE